MSRLNVQKTYKVFIGGQFPRTESGRYYPLSDKKGKLIANMCLCSRKDVKLAVVAARKAQQGWAAKTAYNRSQILYRMAEMLETRGQAFVEELVLLGVSRKNALAEVQKSVDVLVYYAGWCDKYQAVFSSVNPVASSHFNFSAHEPVGVVAMSAPEQSPLLGAIHMLAPAVAGGNAVIIAASESRPTTLVSFAEIVQNSDVPAGVINILTGSPAELVPAMTDHMDVDAYAAGRTNTGLQIADGIIANVKRMVDWSDQVNQAGPYKILDLQELKTTWHPVQMSSSGTGGY